MRWRWGGGIQPIAPIIALLVSLLSASPAAGETTKSFTMVGIDPANMVDWVKVDAEASEAGRVARERALETFKSLRVAQDSPPSLEAERVFREVAAVRRSLAARSPASVRDGLGYLDARARRANTSIALELVATDDPYAVTFPDGHILLARRFVDGFGADAAQRLWILRFVAAHELTHFYDAHALFDWQTRAAQKWADKQRAKARATVGRRNTYRFETSTDYDGIAHHAGLLEFVADQWAYYTLRKMGAPQGVAVAALTAMRDAAPTQGDAYLFNTRSLCMSLLDGPPLPVEAKVIDVRSIGGRAILPSSFVEYIGDELQLFAFERASAPSGANYYLACMSAALVGQSEPEKVGPLFATKDPHEFAARFIDRMKAVRQIEDTFAYPKVVDGLMLEEPAEAATMPDDALKGLLNIGYFRVTGRAGKLNWIEADIVNAGPMIAAQGFIVSARRDGAPRAFTRCAPKSVSDEGVSEAVGTPCSTFVHRGPLRRHEDARVYFAIEDDGTGDRTTPTSFFATACDPREQEPCGIKPEEQSPAERREIVDRTSDLQLRSQWPLPKRLEDVVSLHLGIKNLGGASTLKAYRLIGIRGGEPLTLYPCAELAKACQAGIIIPAGVTSNQEIDLSIFYARDPKPRYQAEFGLVPCKPAVPGESLDIACREENGLVVQ